MTRILSGVVSVLLTLACSAEMLFISHRGECYDRVAPENSMPAYRLAVERGADGFELDVYRTADNRLICFHDDKVKLNGKMVKHGEATLAQLQSVVIGQYKGKDVHMPTLEEALTLAGDKTTIVVEIKDGVQTVPLVKQAILKATNANPKNIIFISFLKDVLMAIQKELPGYRTSYSAITRHWFTKRINNTLEQIIADAKSCGVSDVGIGYSDVVDADYIRALKAAGFNVNLWTVDEFREVDEILKFSGKLDIQSLLSNRAAAVKEYAKKKTVGAAAGLVWDVPRYAKLDGSILTIDVPPPPRGGRIAYAVRRWIFRRTTTRGLWRRSARRARTSPSPEDPGTD